MGLGRVLLVDDDRALRDAVGRALRLEGYEVVLATDGPEALDVMARERADLVVLDVSMPAMSGFEVCRRIRAGGDPAGVLMLTARDGIPERVAGLNAGADDYLVKPFALDELLARVRAGLRRCVDLASGVEEPPAGELAFADVRIDLDAQMAFRGSRRMDLTRTEYLLLEYFLTNPRQVLSRSVVFDRVWGCDIASTSKVLDVYVCYLRRKMEAAGESRLLHTVRSVGYVLREDE
jgi:two-component system, OmpR family, response regulator MprA